MYFVKVSEFRKLITPLYGKGWGEKIKILWKEGLKHHPAPTICIAFVPIMLIHGTLEFFFHDTRQYKKKYLQNPPIYRPGDPRIADIQHYSGLD